MKFFAQKEGQPIAGGLGLRQSVWLDAGLFLFFSALALFFQYRSGGFASERGNHCDEAAHFVSSLVMSDYVASGFPADPVAFAKDFYGHFPKVAIGHWPPFFESSQALVFLIFGGTAVVALEMQAAIAGLAAALPAMFLTRSVGLAQGLLAGLIVLLSPVFLPMINTVMADTLLAAGVTLTAICWSGLYREKSWRWVFLFVLAASASILTKGTAFGLALLPFFHLAIKRDFAFLFNRKTLAAAVGVAVLTVPWYVATYQMAADGFVYSWGLGYTKLALPFFAAGLVSSLGLPCVLAYVLGLFWCVKQGAHQEHAPKLDVAAFAAGSLAMIVFSMAAPADLDRRYLIPAFPCLALVAVWGVGATARAFKLSRGKEGWVRAGLLAFLLGSMLAHFGMPHPKTYHASELVETIKASGHPNPFVLVSGAVPAEGAFIAAFAEKDPHKSYYVIRAQKALAETDWMGKTYTLRHPTQEDLARWIQDSQIGWIVLDSDAGYPEFPHNALLKAVLDGGALKAELVTTLTHEGGQISLYALPAARLVPPMSDNIKDVLVPGHLERL